MPNCQHADNNVNVNDNDNEACRTQPQGRKTVNVSVIVIVKEIVNPQFSILNLNTSVITTSYIGCNYHLHWLQLPVKLAQMEPPPAPPKGERLDQLIIEN